MESDGENFRFCKLGWSLFASTLQNKKQEYKGAALICLIIVLFLFVLLVVDLRRRKFILTPEHTILFKNPYLEVSKLV